MNLMLYAVVGVSIGMLVNYLADVLPFTRKLSRPICQQCQRVFSTREYLFSFACKGCGKKPSSRFFIVMVVAIILSILLYYFPFSKLSFWATLPIFAFLTLILVIDIEHRAVLIETSIAGLLLFMVYGIILHGFLPTLIGGIVGFLIMFGLYYFGKLFTRMLSKIRHQEVEEVALGFGDVYVCSFLGLLNGWPTIIGAILIGILASGVFSLFLILIMSLLRRYRALTAIPYTPFLIFGAVAVFYIRF